MTGTISHEDLSELIGRIYDCTLDPSQWDATLAHTLDLLRCRSAVLHLNDVRHNRILLHKGVGLDPDWVERMGPFIPDLHALLPAEPALDEPYVLSRDVPRSVVEASPYVQEWLRPQGYVDITQLFLLHTPSRFSGFGLSRHQSAGLFGDREIELLRILLPHVRRAVTISNALEMKSIEKARMSETLDKMNVGAVLTNEDGRILYANRAAEAMMRKGGALRNSGGILTTNGPAASAEIKSAIKIAARNESGIGKAGLAVRLTEDDALAMIAHVLPLGTGEVRSRLEPGSVAAVFINPAADDAASARALSDCFGLTPAETRVLTRILSGKTVAETAADLGIAATTARTHLDSIFVKTGVSRQAELFRLAAHVAPPVGPKS
ncbi:MAG: LuxR C-terminal-related transcriptional regulator [Hyphomicrobiaceae bacterium]